VHTSVAGSRVRIQISNLFGDQPLEVDDIHIALRRDGSSIVPGSDRQLRFKGQAWVAIPPGASTPGDPIPFDLPAVSDLAISFYLPKTSGLATFHPGAHRTSYIAAADVSGSTDLTDPRRTASYYFLMNVDVEGKHLLGTVVTLGASITEGHKAADDTNRQWPSVLARRLADRGIKIGCSK
jgi:hypothetical protein